MSPAEPGTQPLPAVSVVLPVRNEEKDIGALLRTLLSQEEPPGGFEVLVADGGSADRTRAIVAGIAAEDLRVQLLDNPGVRSSAGRNVGALAARGEYVLFLDGHCSLPRQDYLRRLVEIFRSTEAACLCRPQPLLDLAEDPWGRAIATARHSWLGHNPRSDIYRDTAGLTDPRSAGAAYRHDVIRDLQGYDERFDACEDVEFNHRIACAGYKAYLHPDLCVRYRPRGTLRGLFGQMRRYGRGRARLMAKHPAMTPWPLVGLTAGVILLCILPGILGWTRGGQVLAGVLIVGVASFLAEGVRLGGVSLQALRVARVFPVLYAGLLLGFWLGLPELRRFRGPTKTPFTAASIRSKHLEHQSMRHHSEPGEQER